MLKNAFRLLRVDHEYYADQEVDALPTAQRSKSTQIVAPLMTGLALRVAHFGGTLRKSDQMSFNRLIFRSTRGKAYVHFFDLQVNETDRDNLGTFEHVVFIIVFEEGPHMRDKIKKICNSVSDNMFEIQRDQVTN